MPESAALGDLRSRLNGTLMLPGDSGYGPASAPANGRYLDIRPAAVARCADEADVVTCVDWCTENGVAPVGRGGGHSYAGYSTTTGLLIDIRRLNSVHVDRRRGTMVSGGAALNGDYFVAFEDGPLFLPGGTCLGVGVGGLVLGGGIGYNTHWAGLTADHLVASRIVTAGGEILDIDASTNPDLYWACRGGAGGSFGINTSFTFDLVEAPTGEIGWYRFEWRGADAAAAVLAAFDALIQTAPPALNAVAMAEAAEVGDGGPREAIDVMSRGQYVGPLDELRDLVAPLLAAAEPTKQTLEARTFWDIQRTIATGEPDPHSFGDISRYAAAPLPDSAIAAMVDLLVECPSRSEDANGSIWSLGWVGGAVVNATPRTATAYVHRGVTTLLRPTTVWPNDAPASVSDGLNAWTDAVIAAIAPHTLDESYQNFPNRSLANWERQYYAENFERLVDVKARYDPGNLFHHPQSIPPRRP
jgi:FAD/FMN-containing dehydrogenase